MKKIIPKTTIILCIALCVLSCDNNIKEYHNNGRLKRIYSLKNDQYNGEYKEYDINGEILEKHFYQSGKKIDSSIFYSLKLSKNSVDKIIHWSDSSENIITNYTDKSLIKSKGFIENEDISSRIGHWRFFNHKNNTDSIVEYIKYKDKPYANQIWLLNSREDTLLTRGNYYRIATSSDTVTINKIFKIQIFLFQPFYSYHESEVSVIIPKNQNELNEDYSNLFDIETNLYENLNKDGIVRPKLDKSIPKNRIVTFGVTYDKPGAKRIKGVLIEAMKDKDTVLLERFLFFDQEIYVKNIEE